MDGSINQDDSIIISTWNLFPDTGSPQCHFAVISGYITAIYGPASCVRHKAHKKGWSEPQAFSPGRIDGVPESRRAELVEERDDNWKLIFTPDLLYYRCTGNRTLTATGNSALDVNLLMDVCRGKTRQLSPRNRRGV